MKTLFALLSLFFVVPCAYAQTDAAGWKSDLEILRSELPRRHVNAFFRISAADFGRRIDALEARLTALNDDERYVEAAKIVAAIGDAHTNLSPPPATSALPIMVYRFRDGLYITNTVEPYKALLYGQITAIENHPIDEVEQAIAAMVPHDNEATVWLALGRLVALTRVLRGLDLIPDASGASLTVKKGDGTTETVKMAAVPMAVRPAWVAAAPDPGALPLYRRNAGKFYWYEYLPESNTLYVKYNSCQEMKEQSFSEFTRQVFERLDQSPGARLVVDVRNNGGGNSGVFSPFLDALKRRPALPEKRRLVVIVGRQTFSSAILNAISLKQDANATLVGEPTSGRPNHYGELRSLALPFTGLKVSYSTQYFKQSIVDSASLEPDIRVEMTIADLVAGRDPVLERALGLE